MFDTVPTFPRVSLPSQLVRVTRESNFVAWTSSPEELFFIAQALAIAVDHDFMAREHGAKIWKRTLANSGFDLPKGESKSTTHG